jgi:hypothetical protein
MNNKTSQMKSTLNMSVFNVNDLPFSTKFLNANEVGDTKSLVMKLSSADDVDEWLRAFESASGMHCNARKTFPNLTRLHFRKDYVCHHSAFNKVLFIILFRLQCNNAISRMARGQEQ